jgi:hypothetical protein
MHDRGHSVYNTWYYILTSPHCGDDVVVAPQLLVHDT